MLLRKFLNDSFWLSIGKFGTTLISFFLVPLYTYYLTPEEYGLADLILTASVLLIPIVTCQTADAIQTFVLKNELDGDVAFSNAVCIFLVGWLMTLFAYPLVYNLFHNYSIFLYVLVLAQGFSHLAFGLNKGLDKLRLTSLISIAESAVLLILMLSCLAYFELGIEGFLLALILSKTVAATLYILLTPIKRFFKITLVSKTTLKLLLIFSLPLVPNMIGWWINNASDRFMINHYLGLDSNGLYAVGSKIPAILNIFSTILVSSWHISALQNYERKNTPFFNKANTLFAYVFLCVAMIIVVGKDLVFSIFVTSDSFKDAVDIIPLLTFGAALSAMSSVLGVVYLGESKTGKAAYTTLIGGILNILFNIVLIPRFGLIGAAWGTVISFFVVLVIRYFHVYKVTSIRVPAPLLVLSLIYTAILYVESFGLMSNGLFLLSSFGTLLVATILLAVFISNTNILKEMKIWKRKF